MIVGLGTDIVEVDRIAPFLDTASMRDKIFTKQEQTYLSGRGHRYVTAAGMWAAKESYIKASGERHKPMNEIEVMHDDDGKPFLAIHGENVQWIKNVSISNEEKYATAVVIIERRD